MGGRGLKIRFCEDREGVWREILLTLMEFCAFGGGLLKWKTY